MSPAPDKISVFKTGELDETGVTTVWAWLCPNYECFDQNIHTGSSLFWENAVRGARYHLAYHSVKGIH